MTCTTCYQTMAAFEHSAHYCSAVAGQVKSLCALTLFAVCFVPPSMSWNRVAPHLAEEQRPVRNMLRPYCCHARWGPASAGQPDSGTCRPGPTWSTAQGRMQHFHSCTTSMSTRHPLSTCMHATQLARASVTKSSYLGVCVMC